jgi:rod shape-determining protein MreD
MRQFIRYFTLVVILLLQLSLSDLSFFPSVPNLVLVYLCVNLIFLEREEVLVMAIFSGLMLDVFSGLPDGVMTFGVLVGVAGAHRFGQMLFAEKYADFLVLFYILAATIIFTVAVYLLNAGLVMAGISQPLSAGYLFSYKAGADVIFNLLFLYPIYWIRQLEAYAQSKLNPKHQNIT